jgi:hypothetical protein
MEIVLERVYFPEGTNGVLNLNGKEICKTIELPWRNNKARVSCIPEGKYKIRKRYSAKFKWHLELINVKNRKYILLHPANNALKELNGCIAPVSQITGEGRGNESRKAFEKLKNLIFPYLENGFVVELIVTKKKY